MFERVIYADLQFAGSPREKTPGEGLDQGELTYENLQGPGAKEEPPRTGQGAEGQSLSRETEGPAVGQGIQPRKEQPAARTRSAQVSGHQRSAGWSPGTRWAALGVLGIGLFLLSVTISLGVQYAQLQQASRDRVAELNSILVALRHSWAAGNRTQQQLQQLELQLDQANRLLALLMANLSQASSCQQIGCCPQGWKLFRWKCLWISDRPATWSDSQQQCKDSSSELLILKKPWDAHDVWPFASSEQSNPYWIGLKRSSGGFLWVDQTPGLQVSIRTSRAKYGCVELLEGALNVCSCYEGKRFICERPAQPQP